VFAIHDPGVKSFSELDKKLASIKTKYWQGKDLPFPVLLDTEGKTGKLYGIHAWPTGLLIDPSGKLVGETDVAGLEAKLPRLSAAKIWGRQRDIQKNYFWSFEPNEYTLNKFADGLKRWARCEVTVDADAVKASGLTSDGPLPGVVLGGQITLRSIEELLLTPHGLGLEPSADGNNLLITRHPRQPAVKNAESHSQKLRAKELEERLDRPAARDESKSLEIQEQPLVEAIKRVSREFDLPVGIDAKAMRDKILDPMAKVSGRIGPGELRKSLLKTLNPLGLTIEVRSEVVLVTPKRN